MARNGQRIEFTSFQAMATHLDRWADRHLVGPEAWEDALVISRAWLDYSARNQVLLASYGVDGPVAGPETWRLVPSTTEDRGCAVRAGAHGWPVRVPVTTGGREPDPFLGGHRPTRAAVERWEWRPVFEVRSSMTGSCPPVGGTACRPPPWSSSPSGGGSRWVPTRPRSGPPGASMTTTDPLADALRLLTATPPGAAEAFQGALRRWVATMADRYNGGYHWPHPIPRRAFPSPLLDSATAD